MNHSKKKSEQENPVNFPKVEEIRMMISTYNKTANQLQNFYLVPSYMGLLNVGRKELSHSRFLAWLFDKKYFDQNSVNSPLFFLLDIAMRRAVMQDKVSKIDDELYNSIIFRSFDIIDSTVILEDHFIEINTNKKPRSTDILITLNCRVKGKPTIFPILICIENKVLSKEHDNQTKAYCKYYDSNYNNYKKIYLYLTPLSSSKLDDYKNLTQDEKCECDKFIQINYQDIVDFILEPLMKIENNFSQKYFIIDDYIKTLRYPLLEEKENKQTIMATSENEKKLLADFWNTNHELIELAIRALGYDSSNKLSSVANKVSKSIDELQAKTENNKDTRKFIIVKGNKRENTPKGKMTIAIDFAKQFYEIEKDSIPNDDDQKYIDVLNQRFRELLGKVDGKTIYFVYNDNGSYLVQVCKDPKIYFKAGVWGNTGPNWPPLEKFLKEQKPNKYDFIIEEASLS